MISLIMLTYNREDLVGRAIESVLAQTHTDYEFIIINNGSSDRSGEVAEGYAQKDARIRVQHRQRGNIGSGRNAGLDMARGEWIGFIDDDDWCEPDYLAFLLALAQDNDAQAAICGAADKAFDEQRVMTAEQALTELMWRKRYNVAFPAKLFAAKLFDGIRFSETAKYDDIELMPRIMGSANRVAYHGLPKYTFERHANNNSAWTTNHSLINATILDEYLGVYRARTQWLCDRFPDSVTTWRYFEWSFMLSMVEKVVRLQLSDCEPQRERMARELRENREAFLGCGHVLDFEKEWLQQYV